MSLLDRLKKNMKKGGNKTSSIKKLVRNATGCSYSHIYIPDKHMDLVNENDAKEFLKQDLVDRENYVPERFDCDDFARNLYNNARNYGLKIKNKNWYWADVWTKGHALNLYVTEDFKVVIVEPQTDEETTIRGKTRFVKF